MAVQYTGSITPGPGRIRDFRHRLVGRLTPILVDVRLDAVAKAGNEGLQQTGAEDDLGSSPTSGPGASAVHDLVTNDAQVSEQVVQRVGDLSLDTATDSVVQPFYRRSHSSSESTLPLLSAPHIFVFPPSRPERAMRLPQLEDANHISALGVQYAPQFPPIVTRQPVVELLSLLPVLEP